MKERFAALSKEEQEKLQEECTNKHLIEMRKRSGKYSTHITFTATFLFLVLGHKYGNPSTTKLFSPVAFMSAKNLSKYLLGDISHREYYSPEEAFIIQKDSLI